MRYEEKNCLKNYICLLLLFSIWFSNISIIYVKANDRFDIIWLEKEYDSVGEFKNGFASVSKNGKKGFIDQNGNEVIPLIYEEVEDMNAEGVVIAKKPGSTGFVYLNSMGREIFPTDPLRSHELCRGEGLYRVSKNGKYGFVDKTGKVIVPIIHTFHKVGCVEDGFVTIYGERGEGKIGIDRFGKKVHIERNKNLDYGIVKKPEDRGNPVAKGALVNVRTGEVLTAFKYSGARGFKDGLGTVSIDNEDGTSLWGVLDTKGNEVVEVKYDGIWDFDGDTARFLKDGKVGYVDRSGKEITPNIYEFAGVFEDGLAIVEDAKGNTGMIDKTGRVAIPLKHAGLLPFYEDRARFISRRTNRWTPNQEFFGISHYANNVEKFGRGWGFIDRQGNDVTQGIYDYAEDFVNGYAVVVKGGKLGIIDKNGKEVVPIIYDYCENFRHGYAVVTNFDNKEYYKYKRTFADGIISERYLYTNRLAFYEDEAYKSKSGVVDENGNEVLPMIYDHCEIWSENYFLVEKDHKFGILDKNQKEVLPIMYDGLKHSGQGMFVVKQNNRYGLIRNSKVQSLLKEKKHYLGVSAKHSNVKLSVDGKIMEKLESYNIANHNYVKLRDIAKLLSEGDKKFSVDWNNEKKLISIVKGSFYISNGSELKPGNEKEKEAFISSINVEVDGKSEVLRGYTINGNNYYKIRDLAGIIGFNVEWNPSSKMIEINTK